jgi:hypothetical protein
LSGSPSAASTTLFLVPGAQDSRDALVGKLTHDL